MSIQFKQDAFIGKRSVKADTRKGGFGDIPTSDELSGIELRLSKVFIKDNNVPKVFPFPGLAKMYLMIIVISDLEEPVQNLDLKGFAKVDDEEELPVDRTIFYWKKTAEAPKNPSQIHTFVSVIKSREGVRKVGNILAKVKKDEDYKSLVGSLKGVLAAASGVAQVSNLVFDLASIVGKYMGKVEDKPLMTWVQSFTDINGDLDFIGKKQERKENKNAELGMTIIVRDRGREEKARSNQSEAIQKELDLETQ